MYNEIAQLLMYGDLEWNEPLELLGDAIYRFETGEYSKIETIRYVKESVKKILMIATDYGFDDNLWHNYLTFFMMMNENPFSLTCEKVGANEGSVNALVMEDFKIFKRLFDYDFSELESKLGINCFSQISDYKAVEKKDLMYNKSVSEKVRALSKKLEAAKDEQDFFNAITSFYKDWNVWT